MRGRKSRAAMTDQGQHYGPEHEQSRCRVHRDLHRGSVLHKRFRGKNAWSMHSAAVLKVEAGVTCLARLESSRIPANIIVGSWHSLEPCRSERQSAR
jgi:hypothetical protein